MGLNPSTLVILASGGESLMNVSGPAEIRPCRWDVAAESELAWRGSLVSKVIMTTAVPQHRILFLAFYVTINMSKSCLLVG